MKSRYQYDLPAGVETGLYGDIRLDYFKRMSRTRVEGYVLQVGVNIIVIAGAKVSTGQ